MGIFQNPFFSLSGQKERIENTAQTLSAVVQNIGSTVTFGKIPSAGKISSPLTGSKGAAAEFIANNPLSTAGLIAGGSSVAGAAKTAFTNAGIVTKGGVLLGVGVLGSSDKARTATIKAASQLTPESLVKGGTQLGTVIDKPYYQVLKILQKKIPYLRVP